MKRRNYLIATALIAGTVMLFFGINKFLFSNNDEKRNSEISKEVTMEDGYIRLPKPSLKGEMTVEESLQHRRSVRGYKSGSLSLNQVSQVLWAAYGISDSTTYSLRKLRTAPSAGATYPLEIYLMAGKVDGLVPGLYRYIPDHHYLQLYSQGDLRAQVAKACLAQMMLAEAPASLVYSAVYSRTVSRYGDRGAERYVCMDLGHSAQNVYLQATAIGLATCAIGAFNDEQLASIIKPPAEEKLLYLMPIGEPR